MTEAAVDAVDDGVEPELTKDQPFVIVPTLDGYARLEGRVKQLEQRGATESPAPALTLAADPDRLDRHRAELEALKRWCNETSAYLRGILPANIPAPPRPEDYL